MTHCAIDHAELRNIPRPQQFSNRAAGGWIVVKVDNGVHQREFQIHKDLAMAVSGFFRGCFSNPGTIEAQTRMVTLHDADPDAFAMLVDWMYYLRWSRNGGGLPYPEARNVYILADRLMIDIAKNELMDRIRQRHVGLLLRDVGLADNNTTHEIPPTSTLHDYIVDVLAWELNHWYGTWVPNTPGTNRFMVQRYGPVIQNSGLVDAIFDRSLDMEAKWTDLATFQAAVHPTTLQGCFYHDHNGIRTGAPY